jgi:polar amino acid transport system substrate-binding protein
MARNPEREGDFRWVGRLVEIKLALSRLRRREELDVGSLEQARSKGRVLTLAGDATLITLRALGFGDESLFVLPDRAPTTDQRIRLLEMGRAEYWISNPFSQAWRLSRGERVGDLVPVVALPGVEALYLAAHPDTDPRLVDALTAAFAEMERDGTSAAVRQRYAPP